MGASVLIPRSKIAREFKRAVHSSGSSSKEVMFKFAFQQFDSVFPLSLILAMLETVLLKVSGLFPSGSAVWPRIRYIFS